MKRAEVTRRLVGGGPDSVSGRQRLRRWALLRRAFPALEDMSVLDLGGTAASWRTAELRPGRLVLLNLEPAGDIEGAESVVGDACEPPAALRREHFDLVFSNSVIEHVGGHARRQAFAGAARSLGNRLWIQTPYRYFPLEPHFVAPGLQFLPIAARAHVVAAWPLVGLARSVPEALAHVQSIELLSRTEMAAYFPDCRLEAERFLGLTKSLTAVR